MADNLESYFKKHLSDDAPAEDNWNVPSDDVWDKALPEIHKKKGLFIPWKYLYIIGGILFSVLLFIFFWPISNEEFDQSIQSAETITESSSFSSINMDEPVTKQLSQNESTENIITGSIDEHDQASMTSLNNNNEYLKSDITDYNDDEVIQEIAMVSSKGKSDKKHTIKTEFKTGKEQSGSQISVNNNFLADTEKTRTTSVNNFSFGDEVEKLLPEKLPGKTIDNITSVAALKPLENNQSISPPPIEKQTEKLEPFNNKNKFGVGVYFAPTFTATYLTGDLSAGKIETNNMFLYSNNWGFELKYFISNRFTLVAGIGLSEVRSWSKSLVDFDYDSSNEHIMDTGEKENTSSVPMPTPFGEIGTEITYRFPGEQQIPDGEIMQSELETHQEVRYLSIPLGVEFNIIRFSRFNWFVETGIRYNSALKDAASFSSRVLHEGHDMDVVGEEMTGHPSYKENYFDLYLGTGVNYQFSKSFQIIGSARYFNSITNVNFQDNMSTHVRGFNLKIGIAYIF